MSLTLVLGGTRSGKSRHAEELALASGLPVRYVATADGGDASMADRIRRHVERRPPDWTTVEAGDDLAGALGDGGECVLVDGLGVWIAGVMHRAESPARARARVEREIERLAGPRPAPLIVVAEETGQGLLPPDALSRAWLDLLGEAKLRLAEAADRVELVVAGRAIELARAPAAPDPALRAHGDAELAPGLADHAVSVMAGGPPDWLRESLHAALDADGGRYPDEREATVAVAALHERAPEDVVPTNGAGEALWLLPAALRPRHAVCIHPAFTEAEAALRAHGVPVERVLRDPDRGFALDPAAVPEGADLIVLGNPASPSGTLDPASAVLALRRPGRTVVVDEAFMDLVPGEPATLVGQRLDDVIVVRSLTKSMGIPGLRAGYALAAPGLAERLRAVRPPWSVNALALTALAAVARRPEALAAAAARAEAERADLAERLAALPGLRTWPSAANYCLVEVADGPRVAAALRERGIAVRPAASFPGLGPGHLRIAARAPAENERLAWALAQVLATETVEAP
jgi:histidinol-phosphate/aromatic aminotransferase/cobyric acid decarboxylase-like protein/adenosyl cobinamide kinase/adenosyl cobinamide phosphate guanylyltransferase